MDDFSQARQADDDLVDMQRYTNDQPQVDHLKDVVAAAQRQLADDGASYSASSSRHWVERGSKPKTEQGVATGGGKAIDGEHIQPR